MTEQTKVEMPTLGAEGDRCSACRAPLAIDQRYCLQCGQRRGARRVDFAELLPLDETKRPASGNGGASGAAPVQPVAAAPVAVANPSGPWTPLAIVASVATLGLMLLVGVMIGKDDEPSQVTAAAPVAAGPVASTDAGGAADTSGDGGSAGGADGGNTKNVSDKGGKGGDDKTAPASEAPGAEQLDEGDLQALENATGEDAADASNDIPDTVATPGEPPPTDNEEPGGGTDAQVIK